VAVTNKPWLKYKVGSPSTRSNWTEPSCQPCTEVSHVSHVEAALKIVGEKKIRQGLVFDESMLNTERVLVTWVSPNYWANGFRYGNVRFTYDFADLIKGKNFYWVEDMTVYNPTACRILITSTDRSASLPTYDPSRGDGPWWFDSSTGNHYINGAYCLEFMVEDDLKVRKAIPELVKLTAKELDLTPADIPEQAKASETIKRLLSNLASITQGVAELRNHYGTGHGKAAGAKGLQPRHAKLAVGAASTLAVFLAETHNERAP
jgi:hypothetical protein